MSGLASGAGLPRAQELHHKPDPRAFIITYGCQMNEHDSERILGLLTGLGYCRADSEADADLILLNTCAVRETAERRVVGKVGELKRLKSHNPELLIAICGCMTQQREVAERIRDKAPHVDLIFGTHNVEQLPQLLAEAAEARSPVVSLWDKEGPVREGLPVERSDGLRAWVSITYGCNNFCTYCIVPYVRGRERSRSAADIVAEVEALGRAGAKEITLLGQNVNSYGHDLEPRETFAGLLRRIDPLAGVERIRYMTSHPRDFTPELVRTIAGLRKVCEHFHLPIQSGSDRILRLMNRGYDRDRYFSLVDDIRAAVPGAAISTDIIVGFPGETEDDFADTLDVVRRVRFDAAFTFIYSPRTGTPAATMPDQVEAEVKKERLKRLMDVQNGIALDLNRELVGKRVEVLVEGASPQRADRLMGRTRTNKIVIFPGDLSLVGRLVTVEVDRAQTFTLFGRLTAGEESQSGGDKRE
ncbi:MAG: tRNA (N6-isopentenyl adenosine(37)-C2)-methylthiotransferase MiaB [Chloroflexota bacterium]